MTEGHDLVTRVIILVFDSLGIGALPDAADYGDAETNTLANLAHAVGGLELPVLQSLGLGNLTAVDGLPPAGKPLGAFGKAAEISHGKDTTVGLWEMMGVITENPFPTFPQGFPASLIRDFEKEIGREVIGNVAASGTEIIDELGDEHIRTGRPIVYTSADSVFQIATHENVIPVAELYDMCLAARRILTGALGVDRVIARPFIGEPGRFVRTDRRKDFGLPPAGKMTLDYAAEAGVSVESIGKVWDVFSGRGITESVYTKGNAEVFKAINRTIAIGEPGIVFAILGDFDTLWGHRNDISGYSKGLVEADKGLGNLIRNLKKSDILFVVADHGCDPTSPGTDHTREYIPVIVTGEPIKEAINLGIRTSMCDIGKSIADVLRFKADVPGISFAEDIIG